MGYERTNPVCNEQKKKQTFREKRFCPSFHFHLEAIFEEKFEFWNKLQNQRFWVVQFGTWKVCLRGSAPQTHSSFIKLNFSKCLIFQFCSKFELFLQKWHQGESLETSVSLWMSVFLVVTNLICAFISQFPSFCWVSTKSEKNTILAIFGLKIMLFFKWPEIRKYWSDRNKPNYGNGKQHFNFAFSWVKCPNWSYFARYSREYHCRTWLGTP